MVAEGHTVGNHTMHHYDMSRISDKAAFSRELEGARTVTVVNAGTAPEALCLPWPKETAVDLLTGRTFPAPSGAVSLRLPPRTGLLLV